MSDIITLRTPRGLFVSDHPLVMGIYNATPDSFYTYSRQMSLSDADVERRLISMEEDGADIVDIGGQSTRPGAKCVSAEEEWNRIETPLRIARKTMRAALISVDTFHAEVARRAAGEGADIINDISGGEYDKDMFDTIARLSLPYIMMHMRGTPQDMSQHTSYPSGVTAEVIRELSIKIRDLRLAGVADIIVDPGIGFAKTPEQNYQLISNLKVIADSLEAPVLVGLSRKSLITKLLEITTEEALPATVALNTQAILNGASIIRVHDVKEGWQSVRLASLLAEASEPSL
ncbi:MAG: dihydropteroate synthase [Duncaniella sp.]|nr:dihydropteroate synthase [Duncaniella sp.]